MCNVQMSRSFSLFLANIVFSVCFLCIKRTTCPLRVHYGRTSSSEWYSAEIIALILKTSGIVCQYQKAAFNLILVSCDLYFI